MNVISDFKTRFNEALSIRNIKPIELSEITGISKSTISHYMSGYTKPKSDKLYILAKALDVSETWLMGYGDSMERSSLIVGKELQNILFKISRELQVPYDDLLQVFISNKMIALQNDTALTYTNLLNIFKRYYDNESSSSASRDNFAQNDTERRLLMLCRKAGEVSEEEKEAIVNQFEATIDMYLKAKGIKKE